MPMPVPLERPSEQQNSNDTLIEQYTKCSITHNVRLTKVNHFGA